MTGHGYLGSIDPAFPEKSLCERISSDLNFRKIYFLITRASQYHYQQIPGNPILKNFHGKIHRESHPVSMDPNFTPGNEPEAKELFEAKQTFMFSVFNANLQTDMGKTIVRRHLTNTDAQAVWKELSEHMRTSSKGASEKKRC